MAQWRQSRPFRGSAQRLASLAPPALHHGLVEQEGNRGTPGSGRSRISALQERFNTWTYQAINRLHAQLTALRKIPPTELPAASQTPGEEQSLLQRVSLLEDRLCRLEERPRDLERWDATLHSGLAGTRDAIAEARSDKDWRVEYSYPLRHATGSPRSPLEAWLTEGLLALRESEVPDLPELPVPEALMDEEVVLPEEALDLHFLSKSE